MHMQECFQVPDLSVPHNIGPILGLIGQTNIGASPWYNKPQKGNAPINFPTRSVGKTCYCPVEINPESAWDSLQK